MKISIFICYISWGDIKPNPNYIEVVPIKSEDGQHRWTQILEKLTYTVNNGVVDVPRRDMDMFVKWTGNKTFLLSDIQKKCNCRFEIND